MSLKRCKKLAVMLLTVGLILGLMNIAQAQPKSGFAAKVGYFMPGDEDVEDIWGSDFTFGVDYIWAFPPYGIGIGAEYFSKEEEVTVFPVTEKAKWSVIPLTATFLYFLPGTEGFSPYIGAGIGYYLTELDVEMALVGIPFLAGSAEESDIGFHVQAGITLGENLFAEAKYSTADVEGVEAGGVTILFGYRF
jgi:opacity protein-like surface antigen